MIERFTVENYLSYQKEETLSLVASNKEVGSVLPPQWYKVIDGKRILRLIMCVGLNGTGKTKMFSALSYLHSIVTERPDRPEDKPEFRPFLLDNISRNKPTVMSLAYYVGSVGYVYKVLVSAERIEEESLYMMAGGTLVFARGYNREKDTVTIKFGTACDLSKSDQRMLEASVIQNSTVMSVFGSLNLESHVLRDNLDYFSNHISFVNKSDVNLADRLRTGDEERDKQVKVLLLKLLKDVGTNIVDYVVDDASLSIADLVNSGASEIVVKAMREQFPSGVITHKNLRFIHNTAGSGNMGLSSGLESFGTRSIIRLLVIMYDIVMGRRFACIDEIEAGIHSKALAFILKMYLSIADECQIAVATHDLSLLSYRDLRRDAVRMFEKDMNGHTYIKKHEYVHNTINFQNYYIKQLDPKIDELLHNVDLLQEYSRIAKSFQEAYAIGDPVK